MKILGKRQHWEKKVLKNIKDIEAEMAVMATDWGSYDEVKKEYHRLLKIMGNVDGDEVILLTLVAANELGKFGGWR